MADIGFLIIGAQKAGSSSLFEYMRRHPQVHMPPEKGLNYFNMDRIHERGWQWYAAAMMRGAAPDAVCGEATVEYINGTPFGDLAQNEREVGWPLRRPTGESPIPETVPRRIRSALPDVKLVCVLRDPVSRAYSHYRMEVLERSETRTFEEAIDDLMEPAAMARARDVPTRTTAYLTNGEYYRGLAGFLNVFPEEQLLVIFSDELADDPLETLTTVFEFIGVASDFVPENLETRYRQAAVQQRIPGLNLNAWQARLANVLPARAAWHVVPERRRATIDRAYNAMNYRVAMWNARRGIADPGMSEAVRARLIEHYRPEGEALGALLRKDVPWLASW
jgi:hypothetical protein